MVKRFSLAEGAGVRTRELVALDGPEIVKAEELFRREARVLAEIVQAIRAPPRPPVESSSVFHLRLRLTWLGRPIEEFTRATPELTLSPRDRRLPKRDYRTRCARSELFVPSVPQGSYSLGLSLAGGKRRCYPVISARRRMWTSHMPGRSR